MAIIYSYPLVSSLDSSNLFPLTATNEQNELYLANVTFSTLVSEIIDEAFNGTDRYIPRFDGTSSLINSAIYEDNGGNIGIGTQVPGTSKLKVIGNGTFGNADTLITLQVGEATGLGSQIYSTLKLAQGGGNFHEFRGSRSTGEEGSRYRMEEYTDGSLVRMTQTYDGDTTQILYGDTVSFSASSVNLSNVEFIEIREYIDHDNDSNTRFGFPANDTFAIDTNGVERMRINSNGTTQFTGQVTIPETPVAATDAASKAYVDLQNTGQVTGAGTTNTLPIWSDGPNGVLSDSAIRQQPSGVGVIISGLIQQSSTFQSIYIGDSVGLQTTGLNAYNVGIGELALESFTQGLDSGGVFVEAENVAIGYQSLQNLESGTNNVAIGANTLLDNIAGANNIAIGKNSLASLTGTRAQSLNNIALGFNTLGSLTTSDGFVAIGHMAADSVTVGGGGAVVIGNMASKAYTGSIGDAVVIGENALQGSTTLNATNTVIIGNQAAQTLSGTTAQGDVVIGSNAFQLSNSSGSNIIVGYNALPNKSTAVENAIHMFADASSADTNSYAINIGTYDIADAGIGNPSSSLAKYGVTIGGIDNVNEGERGAIFGGRSNTIASGADNAAILGGFDNSVTSVGSAGMALGSNLLVQGANQVVVGRYNVGNNNSKLIVGAGFSDGNRINAFEVKNTSLIKLGKYGQSSPTFPVVGSDYNILVTQPNNEVREVDPVVFDSQLLVPQSETIGGGQIILLGSNSNKLITVSWTGTSGTGTLRLPSAGSFTNKTLQILAADGFDPLTIPSNLEITTPFGSGETIDGQSSYTISNLYDTVTLWSNGTEWFVLQVKT